jgi:hypothetical protein
MQTGSEWLSFPQSASNIETNKPYIELTLLMQIVLISKIFCFMRGSLSIYKYNNLYMVLLPRNQRGGGISVLWRIIEGHGLYIMAVCKRQQ